MNAPQYCEIASTWGPTHNQVLESSVIYRVEQTDGEIQENLQPLPSELVTLVTSAVEGNGDDGAVAMAPCELSVNCSKPMYPMEVTAIDVLCDARHMEVYSGGGEYVCTTAGEHIDELSTDTIMYLLQYSFQPPVTHTTLKFLGLTNKTALTLHSIHLTVQSQSSRSYPGINMEKVRSLMSEVKGDIPDNSLKIMQAMENQQKQQQQGTCMPPLASIMSSLMAPNFMQGVGPPSMAIPGGGGPPSMAIPGGGGPANMAMLMSMFGQLTARDQTAVRSPCVTPTTGHSNPRNEANETTPGAECHSQREVDEDMPVAGAPQSGSSRSEAACYSDIKGSASAESDQAHRSGNTRADYKDSKISSVTSVAAHYEQTCAKTESQLTVKSGDAHTVLHTEISSSTPDVSDSSVSLDRQLALMEERIVNRLTAEMRACEQRIDEKLCRIIAVLQVHTNIGRESKSMEVELDY